MLFKGRLSIWSYLISDLPLSQLSLSGYFWQVAASLLYRPGPAKLKIVRVRSVLNDVSVPFASCPPNWRRSEYYSCQTVVRLVYINNSAKQGTNTRHEMMFYLFHVQVNNKLIIAPTCYVTFYPNLLSLSLSHNFRIISIRTDDSSQNYFPERRMIDIGLQRSIISLT